VNKQKYGLDKDALMKSFLKNNVEVRPLWYLNHLQKPYKGCQTYKIEKASYEYFSRWYFPAIREIIMLGDRRHTPEQIAAMLSPPITPKEAEKALNLLTDLGLIHRKSDGRWEYFDKALKPDPGVKGLVLMNFHKEMLGLAAESLERHAPDERDISSLTVGIKKERMAEIKKKIASLRKELLELACSDESSDQVVHISFQLFPLTNQS